MRRAIIIFALVLFSGSLGGREQDRAVSANPDQRTVERLLESLGPDRSKPAGEVFKNVRILSDLSAGQLIQTMQNGFSRSLNVRCSHCHVPDDLAADEIRAKKAAREMLLMVRSINQQLEGMRNLDTEMATVNCFSCHRGELRPGGNVPGSTSRR